MTLTTLSMEQDMVVHNLYCAYGNLIHQLLYNTWAGLQLNMATVQRLAVCAILLAASVQGCSYLDLKCKVEEFIQREDSQLVGKAEQAFKQAMGYVFEEDISPLLDKAIATIDTDIEKVDRSINKTIDRIESSIRVIIHDAAQTAGALASNMTRGIEEIIHKATNAMGQVENTFYKDASNLLTQINQIVQKGQCMEASGAKQIRDGIYKLLESLNRYYQLSSCWQSLGYKASMSLQDLTDMQLYNYQKQCMLLSKIAPTTPIEGPGGILETYAQGQLYAAEYYCIGENAGSPSFQDMLLKEWLWWGVQYNTWKTPKKCNTADHRRKTVQKLKDDQCLTPVECYEQAMKALQEAEQKISGIQTGLLDLNRTVFASEKQVNTSITGLEASINKRLSGLEANFSKNISTLTTYPCNCSVVAGSVCPSGFSQGYCIVNPFSYYTGTRCCKLCMGTAEEAAVYALADPVPSTTPCTAAATKHTTSVT
jgi:hypothetical protein